MSAVTPFPGTILGQPQQPKLLDRVRIAISTRFREGGRSTGPEAKPPF